MAYVAIVLGTFVSYGVGWGIGVPVLLPFLNTCAAYPFMCGSLKRGSVGQGIGRMLVWALALAACATALSYARPQETGTLFIHGAAYRDQMFTWVRTGIGPESTPSIFIPIHLAHAAVFSLLSVASGSVLSMPMGAALMNYMGHYVGTLAAASARPIVVSLVAWVPWALIRIASFVTLGVVLSGPVLSRLGRFSFRLCDHRPLIAMAIAGLVVDIVLKWMLAPRWQVLLKALSQLGS